MRASRARAWATTGGSSGSGLAVTMISGARLCCASSVVAAGTAVPLANNAARVMMVMGIPLWPGARTVARSGEMSLMLVARPCGDPAASDGKGWSACRWAEPRCGTWRQVLPQVPDDRGRKDERNHQQDGVGAAHCGHPESGKSAGHLGPGCLVPAVPAVIHAVHRHGLGAGRRHRHRRSGRHDAGTDHDADTVIAHHRHVSAGNKQPARQHGKHEPAGKRRVKTNEAAERGHETSLRRSAAALSRGHFVAVLWSDDATPAREATWTGKKVIAIKQLRTRHL
ncbi:hypothetical protein SPHINGO361_130327 [Sphingomonas sp. EC-HK361]|nr:hypothetical protein SPHINGO361_130327 [Sphingomonas sp. EC-HK361]